MTPPNTPVIRTAIAEDVARIGAIAHAAYSKYVPRIGRPPAPMVTDYNVQVAAGRAVVVAVAETVTGYMIAWPQADAYFIDNMAVDPASQGLGLGRRLIEHAVTQANRLRLPALRLYTNELMTENRSMYAHLGFVETHRVIEDGYHRVYMLRHLPNA
jgi:GNAT superfamily N-acetyltransferase